jgi:hypothetical protein
MGGATIDRMPKSPKALQLGNVLTMAVATEGKNRIMIYGSRTGPTL